MSQSTSDWSPQDRAAATAVVNHHAQLAGELDRRTEALLAAVEVARRAETEAEAARRQLLDYLHTELVPHALAEEGALYPVAASRAEGKLLVDGMLGEHRAIVALVKEVESSPSAVRAAGAARALAAIFATHLTKENDLVVPLVAGAPDVSLADVLAGMHELLGAEAHGAAEEASAGGGCGCGGCGCGGDAAGAADAAVSTLTIDPRLDVRNIPHDQRHPAVFSALDGVAPGRALVLIAPHAPLPLLAQIESRYSGQFDVEWLQSGPEVWQIRLERAAG